MDVLYWNTRVNFQTNPCIENIQCTLNTWVVWIETRRKWRRHSWTGRKKTWKLILKLKKLSFLLLRRRRRRGTEEVTTAPMVTVTRIQDERFDKIVCSRVYFSFLLFGLRVRGKYTRNFVAGQVSEGSELRQRGWETPPTTWWEKEREVRLQEQTQVCSQDRFEKLDCVQLVGEF